MATMPMVTLPDGARVPALGLGTWRMGEHARSRRHEVDAVRLALELGYRLIDTAEMYGEGGAEEVVGEALAGAIADGVVTRDEVFVVTKVYPHNASRKGVAEACARSLARLRLDHVDLYLLHWPGSHPIAETIAGFEALLSSSGRIRRWGVSNFDAKGMARIWRTPGGTGCAVNQVYYSASQRGIEHDLLPWQREHAVPTMAYCPIDQGALATDQAFTEIGARHGVSAAQAALAWVMREPDVIAIPKAVSAPHLRDNFAAAGLRLTARDLTEIEIAFPPPDGPEPLAMV